MTDATLELIILDADSGQLKPARVEIIDGSGRNYVAGDALPVGGDCVDREEPAWPSLSIEALARLTKDVGNPFTDSTQFYSVGRSEVTLPRVS